MSDFEVFSVAAKAEGGVKSGVTVQTGETFTVSACGRASFGPITRMTYPDGTLYDNGKYCGAYVRRTDATLPGTPIGALIARIGSGPWLEVSITQTFLSPLAGEVIVAYNDVPGTYGDNAGEYAVMVENHGTL